MINIILMLLIQIYPSQIDINKLYNAKTLPRDQWYEVMSITEGKKKNCINQFLAANYKNSYWGVVKINKKDDCRDFSSITPHHSLNSEFFKVSKNEKGLEFVLQGEERLHKQIDLWNFNESEMVKVGVPPKGEGSSVEMGEYCQRYNNKCEPLISSDCNKCSNGWLNVVGDGCASSYSKMCVNKCGGKGEVACTQGKVSSENIMNLVCPQQVRGAVCDSKLIAYCFEHTVYCK